MQRVMTYTYFSNTEECTSVKNFFDYFLLTLNTDARNDFEDTYQS